MAKHSHDPDDREENLLLLKEEFEKLQKKYSFPKFEELDEEFEIRKIDYDLFLVKESELPEEIRLDNVVILDARELPRFSVEIAYMNPSERAYWEELLGELQRREC